MFIAQQNKKWDIQGTTRGAVDSVGMRLGMPAVDVGRIRGGPHINLEGGNYERHGLQRTAKIPNFFGLTRGSERTPQQCPREL